MTTKFKATASDWIISVIITLLTMSILEILWRSL